MAGERVARLADQRRLVRGDGVEADAVDIVDRRMEADHADDVRRPRLEPGRRRQEGGLLERHLVDHRAAALPWRHRVKQSRAAPRARRCRSARKACGRRRRRSRNRDRRTSTGMRGTAWQPSSSSLAPTAWAISAARFASSTEPSTFETWASATSLCSGRIIAAMASRSMRWSAVSGTTSISRARHQLPGHDVAVMLERREQDAVAGLQIVAAPALRDQVDPLGRAADEDDLLGAARR